MIGFKDLSKSLKTFVVMGWIVIGLYLFSCIFYIISATLFLLYY